MKTKSTTEKVDFKQFYCLDATLTLSIALL